MEKRQKRTCYVQVRLSPDEMARMKALMEMGGYRLVSCFLRDILTQKRFPYRTENVRVTDRELRDRINALVYQVNRIGVNYNQVVASWQKQAQQVRPDGTPYLNTRSVETKLTELMRLTEGLRDEFAVILDVVRKYIGESRSE